MREILINKNCRLHDRRRCWLSNAAIYYYYEYKLIIVQAA